MTSSLSIRCSFRPPVSHHVLPLWVTSAKLQNEKEEKGNTERKTAKRFETHRTDTLSCILGRHGRVLYILLGTPQAVEHLNLLLKFEKS